MDQASDGAKNTIAQTEKNEIHRVHYAGYRVTYLNVFISLLAINETIEKHDETL